MTWMIWDAPMTYRKPPNIYPAELGLNPSNRPSRAASGSANRWPQRSIARGTGSEDFPSEAWALRKIAINQDRWQHLDILKAQDDDDDYDDDDYYINDHYINDDDYCIMDIPLNLPAVPRHSEAKKAMSAGSNGEPMEATTSSMDDTGTYVVNGLVWWVCFLCLYCIYIYI